MIDLISSVYGIQGSVIGIHLLKTETEDLIPNSNSLKDKMYNKLHKSVWGMPRLSEAMKDVISCEKLRGWAHTN